MGVHLKLGQERGQVTLLTSFSVLHVITIVPSHPKQFALTLRFSWHVERFADYPPAPLNHHLSGHSVVAASLITLDPFYSDHTPFGELRGDQRPSGSFSSRRHAHLFHKLRKKKHGQLRKGLGGKNRGRFQARFAYSQQEGVSAVKAVRQEKSYPFILRHGAMPSARAGVQSGVIWINFTLKCSLWSH